jgi:hypothetical protein
MTALATMTFRKMNGLGNEFVILDGRRDPVTLSPAQVQAIADRQSGIGCDQLIVMEPSKGADVRMRIWNNDGGEVESCGNASRCVADLLFEETGRETVTIETRGGCSSAPARPRAASPSTWAPALRLGGHSAVRALPRHPRHRAPGGADRQAAAAYPVGRQCRQPPLHLLGR